ncbi:2-amino-4-hydroxy-6-hydroxymethyldihydropteridine diphosphokinase [Parasphingorhabdus cellanae]|uniref:2-amino-4-hydroxy-6-hydroxymethyldihydropteridine pyrophosphokinase n=2 Tax=Parasphingorhabdus cellanae TaxID=2806553 RepID=A0ABX7TAW2_9SPHN|nr:2-amino-4-hydroxy-6-hydroxymethyldihydropteridine diphosphokinase [Parasphingorhabdus cellanae]
MPKSRFLIALGSNQRHVRHGLPPLVLNAAIAALSERGIIIVKRSSIVRSLPIGPSKRCYANAVVIVETPHGPIHMLKILKSVESAFGSRRGKRWSRRVLDLDIILWTNGAFSSRHPHLVIPHIEMRRRPFVLRPAAEIAPDWSDPVTGLTVRQLAYRIDQT